MVPGDHRGVTEAAAKPKRAIPTNQVIDTGRDVADFPLEVLLNAASSVVYGSLPMLARPGSPGPELRPSPSCDVIGAQWR